jgi:hypothetical protein
MSRAAAEIGIHDRLIREAFIDPIRTVIMVDDEYPTLDSLAAKEIGDKAAGWSGEMVEVERIRKLLEFARRRPKPWLVDVHDGKKISTDAERGIATHLDHSDLLVLDYHLDGNEEAGKAAIDILRKLAASAHFNLVIVYTKGYQGDLNRVVREIAVGLTYPEPAFSFDRNGMKEVREALEKWEDEDQGILEKLKAEISLDSYLELKTRCQGNSDGLLGMDEGKRILEIWNKRPKSIEILPKALAAWLVADKQQQLRSQFSAENLGNIQVGRSGEVNWIRTDKLFITVLSKECPPEQLEGKLTDAIKVSFPSPHRLLLTKMRAEIDQHGLLAEAAILGNRHVQAVWLNEFLNPAPIDTRAVIHNTINRHWEALGDELSRIVGDYSEQLREFFVSVGVDKAMKMCGLDPSDINSDESLKRYNCFSSMKQIDRSHLTTGHIFQINTDGGEPSYWICLSPACDMVPGQKTFPGLSDCIAFIAVRLHKVADNNALNNATNNVFLFLDIEGAVETYSIYKDGNVTANPEWEQKFARNKGRFIAENGLTLGSVYEKEGELITEWKGVSVVAQLRSEYALNLLQRIGALLSRPGLGMNFKARR